MLLLGCLDLLRFRETVATRSRPQFAASCGSLARSGNSPARSDMLDPVCRRSRLFVVRSRAPGDRGEPWRP